MTYDRPALKLWVDDETPAPDDTWAWATNVAGATATLAAAQVDELSLDYVLARGETGMDVMEWLRDHPDRWPRIIHAHSRSADGRELIEKLAREWAPTE